MRRERLTGCLGRLILLAASAGLAGGAGEIFLRAFRPQPLEAACVWADGTLRHLPSFRFRYTRAGFSNLVSFNALGLRGPEVEPRPAPGVTRILFLGDSFVEGKQVADDEVVTAVLQRLAGPSVEVVNAGVAGYGTGEELILWERLGRGLDARVVLVGFYPNDVRNNVDRRLFGLEDGAVVATRQPPLPRSRRLYDLRKWLASRSHLYMLFKAGLDRLEREEPGAGGAPLEAEEVFGEPPRPRVARGWELTLALLDELRARVEETGARFVVVLFPTRFQVDGALWREHARRAGLDPAAHDLEIPQRRLASWAKRTGATLIDLLPVFRERNASNSFYYDVDAHWNPAGHRLAAEGIHEALVDPARRGL